MSFPNYKTAAERLAAPCLIARHTCGKVVAVTVTDCPEHQKQVAKDVAGWIRRGHKVESCTVGDLQQGDWCECFDKPRYRTKQETLAL